MTEAGWTADKPNASGWYWNRINGTVGIALIMRRDCQLYAWLRFKDAWLSREGWLDYIHGEWLGPITPDSYQQGRVDSLEQKVEELEMEIKRRVWLSHGSRMKHLLYGDDGKMDCNSCGRDYAAMPLEVAQRYELDDAIKLAQQAQEGGVGE
jgi:hypothetical protein